MHITPVTSKGELRMRELLAQIFPSKRMLTNHRPKWLRGCELDVFLPSDNIAFEYNGRQHWQHTPFFHKTPKDFSDQVGRDIFKSEQCAARGIHLIVVTSEHISSSESLFERIAAVLSASKPEALQSPKVVKKPQKKTGSQLVAEYNRRSKSTDEDWQEVAALFNARTGPKQPKPKQPRRIRAPKEWRKP